MLKLRTSISNIYAVGDAIQMTHPILETPYMLAMAGPANKQARIVADVIDGRNVEYGGAIGSSIAKIFDIEAGSVGLNEKTLKAQNIDYIASFTHSSTHAGYYPGATPLTIKLLFHAKTGQVLGVQVVGKEDVAKKIDVISVYIQHKLTVFDLENFEQAYAPPFNSAKDAVNYCGFVAANILKGDMVPIQWHEIDQLDLEKYCLVDVREPF